MTDIQEFIRDLASARTQEAALGSLQRAVEQLGFCAWDYRFGLVRVPRPHRWADLDILCHLAGGVWRPSDLDEEVLSGLLASSQPMSRVAPFLFGEIASQKAGAAPGRAHMLPHGIRNGLAVPLHLPGNRFGLFNLGSKLPPEDFRRLDRQARPAAALVASAFHDVMVRHVARESPLSLSSRQSECLHWVAQGKTAWETGEILSISERTVKKHLASAMTRLEASTRMQAVAKAAARGLISP